MGLIKHMSKAILAINIFVFLFKECEAWDVSSPQSSENQCAQIFVRSSFLGRSFFVGDEEQFSDLTDLEHHLNKGNEDGTQLSQNESSWSAKIRNGCTLKLSPGTYLTGEVSSFSADEEMLPMVPKSVACGCPKICKCEEHKLRRSECARAYLYDDCSNCKAPFTSFKPDDKWINFPEKWASDVKSIILKSGCDVDLRVVQPNQVPGESSLSSKSSLVTHNIEDMGRIKQYRCTCPRPEDVDQISVTPDYNENYPQLVNVPRTKGGINTLLFNEELRRHPGLLASLQSLRSRRSSQNAYILLLGLTGSGKSSAVNLLFDHPNITKVGDFVSTTTDILEFTISVPVPELGLNNTALHVIDTPGIGDTRGYTQDAQFLATLDEFFKKHDDLKKRLPNVVLIFSKFPENRFRGEGSRFVKMLRTIDLFRDNIIDKKSTNVIFVLTHYMSETKELTKDPRERIQSIREVIEEFSTLPRPIHIVLAENKPEDSQLPSINGFWQLPNGEFYPKNLFDQMRRNLIENDDPIGEAVIRKAFSNSDYFQITGKRHPMLRPSNSKVIKYLGTLASFTKPVSGTEVSSSLDMAYKEGDPQVKKRYPEVLGTLQRALFRKNIIQVSDLPLTSKEIMKLMEDIQVNPLTLFLLEKAFNITVPEFEKDFVVGSGYSLVQDRTLFSKIFDIKRPENTPSDIIFRVPDAYQVVVSHQLDNQMQVFTNMDNFIAGRMKALGLSEEIFPKNSYSSSPTDHPGFNLISLDDEGDNSKIEWNTLSATVDYHTFQIALTSHAKFSQSFLESLEKLQPVNMTNEGNVNSWQNFFTIYGTHVVTHAFGGGSIQVKVQLDSESNSVKFGLLSETMSGIVQQLANDLIGKHSAYVPPPGIHYEFSHVGGDSKHFWRNFSEADETRNIDDWRESLRYNPEVLKSRLTLTPISEVVKKLGENEGLSGMIEDAASQLLNASLIYIPTRRMEGGNPESRDNLEKGVAQGDYESMQEFAEMFNTISASNKEMQQQIFAMMEQSQARKEEADRKYEEQLRLMREEQLVRERMEREDQRYRDEMEFKRQQIENEQLAQERALKLQLERERMDLEMKEKAMLQQLQAQSHQTMLQFLNSENERKTQLMIAQMNQKAWYEKLFDRIGNLFGSPEQNAQLAQTALPLMMAAGAG